MADDGGSSESQPPSSRWTCEACGCHTNTESDDPVSCGVCGTRRVSSLLLRRGILASSSAFGGEGHHPHHHHPHLHRHHPGEDEDDEVEDEDEEDHSDDDDDDEEEEEEEDDEEENDSQNENEANHSMMDSSGSPGESTSRGGGGTSSGSPTRRSRRSGSSSNSANAGSSASAVSSSASGGGGGSSLSVAPILFRSNSSRRSTRSSSGNVANPDELLAMASANADRYDPHWSPSHHGSSIQIDTEGNGPTGTGQIAYLTEGGEEGRSVRALEGLPVSTCPGRKNNVVGWRLVFEHPTRARGRSLGGCYLVGITTDQFADFGERSGLQQSRLFWGVEDGGRRYEGGSTGSGGSASARPGGRRPTDSSSSSSGGGGIVQLTREEAPRNSDNVLFGSREVLTVVADLESRTLSYWREGTFLGTLVHGIPKAGEGLSLYPVAVPFNAGVCVAICGMQSDPVSIMAEYHAAQKLLRERKNDLRRQELQERRTRLLTEDDQLSTGLISILKTIFSRYASQSKTASKNTGGSDMQDDEDDTERLFLSSVEASRLWYRCGLRLSQLRSLLVASCPPAQTSVDVDTLSDVPVEHAPAYPDAVEQYHCAGGFVTEEDFIATVQKVVDEEESRNKAKKAAAAASTPTGGSGDTSSVGSEDAVVPGAPKPESSTQTSLFEVGDLVEVCEGYDRYGDAASGPLRPGDLGTVLEVQRGPRGDRQSIRVLFNGRRWWYQPQALLPERSGLVETSSMRFLTEVLRSHGYDTLLESLCGKNVTSDSWKLGDLVVLKKDRTKKRSKGKAVSSRLGRIVTDDNSSSGGQASKKDTGTVLVDFCCWGSSKKISVDRLVHTDFHRGLSVLDDDDSVPPAVMDGDDDGVVPMDSDLEDVKIKVEARASSSSMALDDDEEEDEEAEDGQSQSSSASEGEDDEESKTPEEEGADVASPSSSPTKVESSEVANKLLAAILDKATISSVIKDCRTPTSLARLYAAGLPTAILKAIDHATDREAGGGGGPGNAVDAAAVTSLGALVLAVSKGLFPEPSSSSSASAGFVDTIAAAAASSSAAEIRSEPSFEELLSAAGVPIDNTSDSSHANRSLSGLSGSIRAAEQHLRSSNSNLSGSGISVRDFVRDLGVGPEQRRGVLLALMASARMHEGGGGSAADLGARSSALGRLVASSSAGDFLVSEGGMMGGRHLRLGGGDVPSGFNFGAPPPPSATSGQEGSTGGSAESGGGASGPGTAASTSTGGPSTGQMPTWSRSLLRMNPATASSSSSSSSSISRSSRSMNTTLKWLIQNGLLLDSTTFAKKALASVASSSSSASTPSSSTDVSRARDTEENTLLFLAVSLGCSTSILRQLLRAGCSVTRKDLEECARTNQTSSLQLLLRQTVYTPNSINVTMCSPQVIDVLADAVDRQIREERGMRDDAVDFAAKLLVKFIQMALRFRLLEESGEGGTRSKTGGKGKESQAKTCVDVLVGEVLLHAIHQSQNQALEAKESSGPGSGGGGGTGGSGDDGRVPAFPSPSSPTTSSSAVPRVSTERAASSSGTTTSKSNARCTQLSLIDILPPPVFAAAFGPGKPEKGLISYLALTEAYLWKKDMKDAVVGLTLANALLTKALPPIDDEGLADACVKNSGLVDTARRYGLGELASNHMNRAEEALREIMATFQADGVAVTAFKEEEENKDAIMPVVKCPKGHTTILHLTRHSSFRCDLCGKGVEQGKPMHGCRECDWDACESCTDRKEGGLVKWRHIRRLALDCRDKLPPNDASNTAASTTAVRKDLEAIARGIQRRNPKSVRELGEVLDTPGKVSLFEFVTYILPALHQALTDVATPRLGRTMIASGSFESGGYAGGTMPKAGGRLAKQRRIKKPRVGAGGAMASSAKKQSTKRKKQQDRLPPSSSSSDVFSGDKTGGDRAAFLKSLLFLLGQEEDPSFSAPGSISSRGDEEVYDLHVGDAALDDEKELEDDEERNIGRKRDASKSQLLRPQPELLRRLHATLAFHEHVTVTRHTSHSPSSSPLASSSSPTASDTSGDLQSLLLPFELELHRYSPSSSADGGGPKSSSAAACSDLEGTSLYMEPLMPLVELQRHVLRCSKVGIPAYLTYCRRLVQDRAIIAERPVNCPAANGTPSRNNSTSNNNTKSTPWQIARVVGYDEKLGCHVVRYASQLVSDNESDMFIHSNNTPSAAGGDDDMFEGPAPREEKTIGDQLEFQGREALLVLAAREYCIIHREGGQSNVNSGMMTDDVEMVDVEEMVSAENKITDSLGGAITDTDKSENDGLPQLLLPVGTRVESDVNSDSSYQTYTILRSYFELTTMLNGADLTALMAQLEESSDHLGSSSSSPSDSMLAKLCRYTLTSENGEVIPDVSGSKIKGHDAALHRRCMTEQRRQGTSGASNWGLGGSDASSSSSSDPSPSASQNIFLGGGGGLRRTSAGSITDGRVPNNIKPVGVLKRSWSALSPIQSMCPVELNNVTENEDDVDMVDNHNPSSATSGGEQQRRRRKMSIGGGGPDGVEISVDLTAVEQPPTLTVKIALEESHPPVSVSLLGENATLFSGLKALAGLTTGGGIPSSSSSYSCISTTPSKISLERKCKVYYTVAITSCGGKRKGGHYLKRLKSSASGVSSVNTTVTPWIKRRHWDFVEDTSRGKNNAIVNKDEVEEQHAPMAENEMDDSITGGGGIGPRGSSINATMQDVLIGSDLEDNASVKAEQGGGGIVMDTGTALHDCDGLDGVSVKCLQLLNFLGDTYVTFVNTRNENQKRSLASGGGSDKKKTSGSGNVSGGSGGGSSSSAVPSTQQPEEPTSVLSIFVSQSLTTKLLEQLEDPLSVVGGALPDWCCIAPALAPRVFSHSSRRLLLERAAFGVSRSALRQQEAKVAVAPLRARMAALRGRAVELVQEAFSGGAADPTALQLQADELYGMEEALSARVSAAFRAQRWEERSLQCAKAAIRRERLLADACAAMERYATDKSVNRRRLEIRFEGESGFDAASGDEAGVTRGFYADVAEALLSCDRVAGISSGMACPPDDGRPPGLDENNEQQPSSTGMGGGGMGVGVMGGVVQQQSTTRLPLWIPDFDSSGRVVIPTPRADPLSGLGVFPRPLSIQNPLRPAVLTEFRFMGRLFAAAMRDGFVFPLPLSISFLKLVQSCAACMDGCGDKLASMEALGSHASGLSLGNRRRFSGNGNDGGGRRKSIGSRGSSNSSVGSQDYLSSGGSSGSSMPCSSGNSSSPVMSLEEGSLTGGGCGGASDVLLENVKPSIDDLPSYRSKTTGGGGTTSSSTSSSSLVLGSEDLPRPGFLGGDIYAVEQYICAALDRLEEMEPQLDGEQLSKRRQDIARDKTFARKALGKSYDCSFEDYFEGRVFVDPFDPTQDEGAYPLCKDGARRAVTIDNVREWMKLAKRFVLHDGVMAQAMAFRQGVNDFFSADALLLLTPEELQRDVCGGGDNVDDWDEDTVRALFKLDGGKGAAEALVAVAAMGGEGGAALSRRFGPSSPTIGYLVRSLLEASPTQRRQFLSFVTSVPIVTPGQIEVVPVVSPTGEFLPMSDCCLPRANTCARRLYLPKFENFDNFSKVFYAVLRDQSRFKGFFEWRG